MLLYIFFDVALYIFAMLQFLYFDVALVNGLRWGGGQGRDGEMDTVAEQGAVEDGAPWGN